MSETEAPRRGRPERKDRVKECMHDRVGDRGGGFEQAGRECVDRERWRLLCHGHPLCGCFRMK